MRLKGYKEGIIDCEVCNRLYWEEDDIWDTIIWSEDDIGNNIQYMDIYSLTTSGNLITSIYNENYTQ
jgi:hypothetical protein